MIDMENQLLLKKLIEIQAGRRVIYNHYLTFALVSITKESIKCIVPRNEIKVVTFRSTKA